MTYKVVETNGVGTLIEVIVDEVSYKTIVVCNDGELDGCVDSFVQSIKNPPSIKPAEPQQDLNQTLKELKALVDAQATELAELKLKVA